MFELLHVFIIFLSFFFCFIIWFFHTHSIHFQRAQHKIIFWHFISWSLISLTQNFEHNLATNNLSMGLVGKKRRGSLIETWVDWNETKNKRQKKFENKWKSHEKWLNFLLSTPFQPIFNLIYFPKNTKRASIFSHREVLIVSIVYHWYKCVFILIESSLQYHLLILSFAVESWVELENKTRVNFVTKPYEVKQTEVDNKTNDKASWLN